MEIIGRLDDVYTTTGFVISPYVGVIPYPYEFHTSPGEVAYIISLPYKYLKESEPVSETIEYNGKTRAMPSIRFDGDRIWGATYRILTQLKRIVENEKV